MSHAAVAAAPSSAAARVVAPAAARTRDYYRTLSATSVGLELAVAVVFGLFFGMWLDGKLGTPPLMMIVWLVVGFTAGMRAIFRHVRDADREADRRARESQG